MTILRAPDRQGPQQIEKLIEMIHVFHNLFSKIPGGAPEKERQKRELTYRFLALKESEKSRTLRKEARSSIIASTRALCWRKTNTNRIQYIWVIMSVCLPICLSVCLLVCLPACLSLCLPACLYVCLPTHQSRLCMGSQEMCSWFCINTLKSVYL